VSTGLIALLDDVVAIAKVAAASLDDVAAQTAKAGAKAAGIVIDDAAVTPRYVVGFAADRELPIIGKIAVGSLRNKLLFLLPIALALSLLAPWAITPLLMAGGVFLCFEGYEKVHEMLHPHGAGHASEAVAAVGGDRSMEDEKVAGAIRTDFILSAEIMAITLASLPPTSLTQQAVVLAAVGIGVTVLVYGAVALIVKADDFGLHLAQKGSPPAAAFGRALVKGMPGFLKGLSLLGTAAMLWVGGGIILHGLEGYGLGALAHGVHDVAKAVGGITGPLAPAVTWLVDAAGAGICGLAIGWLTALVLQHVALPVMRRVRGA
jgi:predicted DNA repair protein MutK